MKGARAASGALVSLLVLGAGGCAHSDRTVIDDQSPAAGDAGASRPSGADGGATSKEEDRPPSSYLRDAERQLEQIGADIARFGRRVGAGSRAAVQEAERELAAARRDLARASRRTARQSKEAWRQARREARAAVERARRALERARASKQ